MKLDLLKVFRSKHLKQAEERIASLQERVKRLERTVFHLNEGATIYRYSVSHNGYVISDSQKYSTKDVLELLLKHLNVSLEVSPAVAAHPHLVENKPQSSPLGD